MATRCYQSLFFMKNPSISMLRFWFSCFWWVLIVRSSVLMNLSMCNKYITRVMTELSRLAVTPELCSKLAGGESQENGDRSCWGHAGSQGNPYVFSSKWPDLWEFGDVRKYIGGWWEITCILFIQDIYIYTSYSYILYMYIYIYVLYIYIYYTYPH